MKKFFRNLMLMGLALGALVGCGGNKPSEAPVTHYVTFWYGPTDAMYKEVEVEHGKTVDRPEDPTKEGFTFLDWYGDDKLENVFDFATLINEDTDVYAKWQRDYVPSDSVYHIVGDLANTDLTYINWEAVDTTLIDERSYMTKADDSNVFSIELEIGYLGKFKIKKPGVPWDGDTQGQWGNVRQVKEGTELPEYLQESDLGNIQVNDAGLYRIDFDEDELIVDVTRLGDVAEGSGAKPTPEPGTIPDWGLVGTINEWGDTPDFSLTYNEGDNYYHLDLVYLEAAAEFKLRTDNAWGTEHGPNLADQLDDNITFDLDADGNPTGNYKVAKTGIYQFVYEPTEDVLYARLAKFAFRGSVGDQLNWDNDSVEELTVDEADPLKYNADITFAADGEVKVKLGALGPYSGWDTNFSTDEGGGNMLVTAGQWTGVLQFKLVDGAVELDTFTFAAV